MRTKVGPARTVSLTWTSLDTVLIGPGLHGLLAGENVPTTRPCGPTLFSVLEFGVWSYIPECWSADWQPTTGWHASQES